MDSKNPQQLRQCYRLEISLLRLEKQSSALSEKIKEARFNLRGCKENLLNYEGSVRGFFDKLSGKREERTEARNREVRQAEAELQALLRQKESLDRELADIAEQRKVLPDLDALREASDGKDWAALEAKFCAEALLPLLEKNYQALLEYRSLLQGSRLEILTIEKQQEISAGPNIWGEKCRPLMQRLKAALDILQIPFEPGAYYRSPTAYIVSAAAKHNRMDRVNQALDQVLAVKKQATAVLEQFGGEEQ